MALSSALLLLQSLALPPHWVEREAYLMGTRLRVGVVASSRADGIQATELAFQAVRTTDRLLSTWRDDSEIAELNRGPATRPTLLSRELFALLAEAAHLSRSTERAFDPAIGPLVDAWNLRGEPRRPSSRTLSEAMAVSGLAQLSFAADHHTISRKNSRVWLDTGGFGKGAALRAARRVLEKQGIASGILNFGGQVLVLGGTARGEEWIVPVAHPALRGKSVARLHLKDCSAATSSQSERLHVLDPRTGLPVPAWGSVTVVSNDPLVADAVSTALLVLGPAEGLRWAQTRDDIGALFLVRRNGRLEWRWTRPLEKYLRTIPIPQGG